METAKCSALGIRRTYDVQGALGWERLLAIASDLGARVVPEVAFTEAVREVYVARPTGKGVAGYIGLQKGLSASWRRWLTAHALGHHVLHPTANHLYLAACDDRYRINRHEREAETFAGWLMFGALDRRPVGVQDEMDLAVAADLPLTVTIRWCRLVALPPYPVADLARDDVDLAAAPEPVSGEYRVLAARDP